MLEFGILRVREYVDGLVVRLLTGIMQSAFDLVSSYDDRSTLVVLAPTREPAEILVGRLTATGVHIAHRRGRIRISPHVYNTIGDIDRALEVLSA